MKAGRELDALVAEKVMGHKCSCGVEDLNNRANPYGIKGFCLVHGSTDIVGGNYSTNIADAWEVVRTMGMVLIENSGEAFGKPDEWNVQFVGHDKEGEPHWVSESAKTPELAICLAALKAKGVTGEQHG